MKHGLLTTTAARERDRQAVTHAVHIPFWAAGTMASECRA
jgi:hypothetical protein